MGAEGTAEYDSYVVYDCDIGTDDAWGLLMLLRAEHYSQSREVPLPAQLAPGRFKLAAVTCVHGNTDVDNGTLNALRVLSTAGRLDVPVFKGCAESIMPRTWERRGYFHGRDGLGDLDNYPAVNEKALVSEERAVNAMYRLACEHAHRIDFLLVGPLTNFALCINIYGDDFLDKVRDVYIMGGNIVGKGNITKSAEFNFMLDPEAAHIVLERIKKPAWVLPWETCIDGDYGLDVFVEKKVYCRA
ncbi:probable uridine nucleosidase 1 isoform X2 [Scaptodrosophila lebanonensis]|uniref:Probable uridine nucleosidase 1 isoform X2 n=1 Tax=Drosophila lebanonensis TaxID=7225 RepID=A0A6J2TVL5_DROLE|nr:probable uridine nucleosidase 1 isoform X2 [Scaptodrosophila lebanonensis]